MLQDVYCEAWLTAGTAFPGATGGVTADIITPGPVPRNPQHAGTGPRDPYQSTVRAVPIPGPSSSALISMRSVP